MNKEATIIDHESGVAIPAETQKSIAVMNQVAAGLAELSTQYATLPDCSTDEGYDLAKKERKEIAAVRISIEKAHKAGKAFYLDGGRNIDKMKSSILETVSGLESVRKTAIKAIDDEAARIAREAAELEQARIDRIEKGMSKITEYMHAITLKDVNEALAMLDCADYNEFDEFADKARESASAVAVALTERFNELKEQAAEAERLAAQKAEQEKAEAAAKADREKFEAEKREFAEAQAKAKRDKEEAERAEVARQKAEHDKALAIQAAESNKAAAAEQSRLDAIEVAEYAETKRIADIEAARLKAIGDEQERVQTEKRQAAILAASKSDKKQLQAWASAIPEPPAMSTKAGKSVINDLDVHMDSIDAAINSLPEGEE